jgi:hypothetical protein
MDFNINLDDPDKTRKALALGRELVSARVIAGAEVGPGKVASSPPVWIGALNRAVMEILEGNPSLESLAERIGFVIAGLARVGAMAVSAGGAALALGKIALGPDQELGLPDADESAEATEAMLQLVNQMLAKEAEDKPTL